MACERSGPMLLQDLPLEDPSTCGPNPFGLTESDFAVDSPSAPGDLEDLMREMKEAPPWADMLNLEMDLPFGSNSVYASASPYVRPLAAAACPFDPAPPPPPAGGAAAGPVSFWPDAADDSAGSDLFSDLLLPAGAAGGWAMGPAAKAAAGGGAAGSASPQVQMEEHHNNCGDCGEAAALPPAALGGQPGAVAAGPPSPLDALLGMLPPGAGQPGGACADTSSPPAAASVAQLSQQPGAQHQLPAASPRGGDAQPGFCMPPLPPAPPSFQQPPFGFPFYPPPGFPPYYGGPFPQRSPPGFALPPGLQQYAAAAAQQHAAAAAAYAQQQGCPPPPGFPLPPPTPQLPQLGGFLPPDPYYPYGGGGGWMGGMGMPFQGFPGQQPLPQQAAGQLPRPPPAPPPTGGEAGASSPASQQPEQQQASSPRGHCAPQSDCGRLKWEPLLLPTGVVKSEHLPSDTSDVEMEVVARMRSTGSVELHQVVPDASLLPPIHSRVPLSMFQSPHQPRAQPQALLGGGGIQLQLQQHHHGRPCSSQSTAQAQMVRAACLLRYREKKARRSYGKTIRYAMRKANADKRPRIKGRFVKASEGGDHPEEHTEGEQQGAASAALEQAPHMMEAEGEAHQG